MKRMNRRFSDFLLDFPRAAERGCRERCSLPGFGDCSHAPAVRGSAWRKSEIARSACAFAKRARLPQAEDSAPMRVSRIEAPSRFGRQPNVTPFQRKRNIVSAQNAKHSAIETGSNQKEHLGTPKPTAVRERSET